MKNILTIILLTLIGCSAEKDNKSQEKLFYIDDHLVDCVGVGPMKCMLVKETESGEYKNFYDKIQGFDYVEGYTYVIKVKVTERENVPADASKYQYSLVEVQEKKQSTKTNQTMNLTGKWEVVKMKGIDQFTKNPTFIFDENESKVGGSAGCNNYFGSYTIEKSTIAFSQVGATRKMCPDMTTEDAFLKLIGEIKNFNHSENSLEFLNESNELLFSCKPIIE